MIEPKTDEDVLEALCDALDALGHGEYVDEVAYLSNEQFKAMFNSPSTHHNHKIKMWSIDRTDSGWEVTRVQ